MEVFLVAFFFVMFCVSLVSYQIFSNRVMQKIEPPRRMTETAVWYEVYWAYQEGDRNGKLAYMSYVCGVTTIIGAYIAFLIYMVVEYLN